MRHKSFLSVLAFTGLVACASSGGAWVKAGADEDQVRVDQSSCRAMAERAMGRDNNVTRDIRTSIPGGRDDVRAVVQDTRDLRAARSFEKLYAQCMRSLGYTQEKS